MRELDYVILCAILAAYWFYRKRKLTWKRSSLGQSSGRRQNKAAQLLEEKGYEIKAYSPLLPVVINVDGRESRFELSTSLIASRTGETFAVEINSEDNKARTNTVQSRRYYLLDQLAMNTDGVLIVDLDKNKVQIVKFKLSGWMRPYWQALLLKAALVLLILVGSGWLLYSFLF